MSERKYYCRIYRAEITRERYENNDELCDFCEDNEEMDEDPGIAQYY